MKRYLRNLLRAVRGDESLDAEVYRRVAIQIQEDRDRLIGELADIKARYEALLAASTEFRHKSWEITHR